VLPEVIVEIIVFGVFRPAYFGMAGGMIAIGAVDLFRRATRTIQFSINPVRRQWPVHVSMGLHSQHHYLTRGAGARQA
jgi:hypothetical protein